MNNKKFQIFVWLAVSVAVVGGCNRQSSSGTGLSSPGSDPAAPAGSSQSSTLNRIKAIGRLEPTGGVIPIVAKPGDRIQDILVKIGENREENFVVAELASTALLEAELRVAEAELAEANARKDAELDAADAKLAVVDHAIEANRLKLEEARGRLDSAGNPGGEFSLLETKIRLAEETLERMTQASSPGPVGRSLVTQAQVSQQRLVVEATRNELVNARREIESGVKAAEMLLTSAQKERAAAAAAKLAAAAAVPLKSAQLKIDWLREQIEAAKPRMPIAGDVLSIDVSVGQPTSTMPIMQVADLTRMICRAEVPVEDRNLLNIGDRVTIRGGGLQSEITGTVSEISVLVGAPKMTSLNPMDPVDFRMAPVLITIDPQHLAAASKLVNTQVTVEIELRRNSALPKQGNSSTSGKN